MTDQPLAPGANWCTDCGLPRGVCDCAEHQAREAHNDNDPFPYCAHIVSVWDSEIEEYRCTQCGEIVPPEDDFEPDFDDLAVCPDCGDELDEAGPLVFCTNLECGWSIKQWEDETE